MAIESKEIVKAPKSRPTRTPISSRNRLAVSGKDSNFEYRFVNDSNGDGQRVAQFLDASWELASGDEKVGTHRVAATAEGSVKSIPVGQGTKGYLMRIPKDLYDEDFLAKMQRVDETEQSMKQEAKADGFTGRFEINQK